MPFELYRQPSTLRSTTPNNELHGEDHVKVLYMYFVLQLSNDLLPMFGPWMRTAFYKLADNPDLEEQAEQRPTVLTLDASNWQNPKQAYLIQQGPLAFGSTYDRVGAGTTRHWLGTSLRFVPNDFKMKTVYGRLVDWPFGYDELEVWYGRAEHEIGVSADKANQDYLGITAG